MEGFSHNILVIKLRYIGDVLLTTPFLRVLRQGFPEAWITTLVNAGTEDVLRHNPDVNEVLCLPRTGMIPQTRFWRGLRARGFECVVDFTDGDRAALLAWFTGAGLRIGYNHEGRLRGRLYSHCVEAAYGTMHMIDYHAMACSALGLPIRGGDPVLPLSGENHEQAHRIKETLPLDGKPWVMLHPGARYWFKAWSAERFAALADTFHDKGFRVVLVGSPSEQAVATAVMKATKRPLASLVGKTSLLELAALMTQCRLFIGNDAGPMHMAAAVGCPVVALFGPSNPAVWGPRGKYTKTIYKGLDCRECFHPGCSRGEQSCMNLITVQEVLEAAEEFL